jgi:ankyrin repeat protein
MLKSLFKNKNDELLKAAKDGNISTINSLLKKSILSSGKSAADIDCIDSEHNTPLMLAITNKHLDVVGVLLSKEATIKSVNNKGFNPLDLSVNKSKQYETNTKASAMDYDMEQIAELVVNKVENFGEDRSSAACEQYGQAFVNAARNGYDLVVHSLLEKGMDINCVYPPAQAGEYLTNSALTIACQKKRLGVINILLSTNNIEKIDVNYRRGDRNNALDLACFANSNDIVKRLLLTEKCRINEFNNSFSCSPLYIVCGNNNMELINLLLANGANPNIGDQHTKNTCLHLACYNGNLNLVKLLISNNSDFTIYNELGLTPKMVAERRNTLQSRECANYMNKVETLAKVGVLREAPAYRSWDPEDPDILADDPGNFKYVIDPRNGGIRDLRHVEGQLDVDSIEDLYQFMGFNEPYVEPAKGGSKRKSLRRRKGKTLRKKRKTKRRREKK